jgi:hypothetical protein
MDVKNSHLKNAPGPFYVADGCCTACGVTNAIAPDLFASDANNHCYVKRQPSTADEIDAALRVMRTQELGCIRYCGDDETILRRLAEAGESAQCDNASPEESYIVLRNHVTFTAKTPELRDWTCVTILQSLEKFLLRRPYTEIIRIPPVVGDSNEANLLVSWYEGVFHRVTIHSLPGEEQQWLVRHSFNVGLSEFIDDWLKQSEEFDRVRWYSQEQWNGSKDWLDRPW